MKSTFTILVFSFLAVMTASAQTKTIELNRLFRQKVPEGKVWFISNKKTYKVIFSDGVYKSGTACNAAFFSNPSYIYGISYIEAVENSTHRPKTIGFTFVDSPSRLDDEVWSIKPHFFLEPYMDHEDISTSLKRGYQSKEIVFYPGSVVFTSSCLANIIIHERDINQNDLNDLKIRAKKAANEQRLEEIEYKRRLSDEREAKLAKFGDLEKVFETEDISNLPAIRYSTLIADSLISLLLHTLVKTVNDRKDSFTQIAQKYKSKDAIELKLNWDSVGNLLKLDGDTILVKSNDLEYSKFFNLSSEPRINVGSLSRKCKLTALITCQIEMSSERAYTFWVKQTKKGYKFATPSKFWADDYNSPKEHYKESKLVEDYLTRNSADINDYTKIIITNVKYSIKASSPMFHKPISKEISGYCFEKL